MTHEASAAGSSPNWAPLVAHATQITFRRGEQIIAQGAPSQTIFIILQGLARVEHARQRNIGLLQLGAGEIIGELAFLEHTTANASVVAEEETTVAALDSTQLRQLLSSEPQFATYFYQTLAVTLAQKLRTTFNRLVRVGMREVAPLYQLNEPALSGISDSDLPSELLDAVDAFEIGLLKVEQGLKTRLLPEESAQAQVNSVCDMLVDLLSNAPAITPLEIGVNSDLAGTDAAQLAAAIGHYVFRETFPMLMLSTNIARAYKKPRGFPEDFSTIGLLYENDATGTGILGRHLDRWYLDSPLASSRRQSCELMETLIAQRATSRSASGPLRITSLASGAARELFHLYERGSVEDLHATCIDLDNSALMHAIMAATELGCVQQMGFLQANVVYIATGQEQMTLPPQALIYALGLAEYLQDEEIITLLDWAYEHLEDGGTLILTNLNAPKQVQTFMEQILEWYVHHRSAEELRTLFARSRFSTAAVEIQQEQGGANLFAICAKGSAP